MMWWHIVFLMFFFIMWWLISVMMLLFMIWMHIRLMRGRSNSPRRLAMVGPRDGLRNRFIWGGAMCSPLPAGCQEGEERRCSLRYSRGSCWLPIPPVATASYEVTVEAIWCQNLLFIQGVTLLIPRPSCPLFQFTELHCTELYNLAL